MTKKRESGRIAKSFQFWMNPEALCECLASEGFSIVDHLDPRGMEKLYLSLKDGTVAENAFEVYRFVNAKM